MYTSGLGQIVRVPFPTRGRSQGCRTLGFDGPSRQPNIMYTSHAEIVAPLPKIIRNM
jgi:hypothetical protein